MNEYLKSPILLRPHHGMCLAFFKGIGYSNHFSAHMNEMLDIFMNGARVQLCLHTDEICAACPNNQNRCCTSDEQVNRYDRAVLQLCGLKEGTVLDFSEFTRMVQKQITYVNKRSSICGDCKWNSICENQPGRW